MPITAVKPPSLLVAACALIDADGRVLLCQRPQNKAMPGLWEFPGGKIESGETPEATIIREMHEELAIDTVQSCLAPVGFASHAYPDFHLILLLFICRKWQGIPSPIEHNRLAWVRPNQIKNYPLPEADTPLVAVLQDLL